MPRMRSALVAGGYLGVVWFLDYIFFFGLFGFYDWMVLLFSLVKVCIFCFMEIGHFCLVLPFDSRFFERPLAVLDVLKFVHLRFGFTDLLGALLSKS